MEKIIFSNNGGLGLILEKDDNESDYIIYKDIEIVDETLRVGDFTHMRGLFTEPVEYRGMLKEDPIVMVFLLGDEKDLFESKRYYSCFYRINSERIANKYREGTVRDFKWIDGNWK